MKRFFITKRRCVQRDYASDCDRKKPQKGGLSYWRKATIALIVVLISTFAVSASSYAQRIKYVSNNVTFRQVFQEINKQTGYHYLWTAKNLSPTKKINVSFNNESLESVLKKLEAKYPLKFEVEDKVIKVRERIQAVDPKPARMAIDPENVSSVATIDFQQIVRGRIVDEKGKPLTGVNVVVSGQSVGIATDANGEFSFKDVEEGSTLVISYIGYMGQTIKAKAELGDITLHPQENALEETTVRVNTGYQSLPRERMTGSFSYVSGEQLETKLASGLKNALEGQAAGVVIDKSGNIEIRGVSTFNAQKAPLVVVDGYPIEGSIDNINPMNIESITVLKDGVAASIYGSRAANGVIVVTTKIGKAGKPRISYSGFANIIQRPSLKHLNRASTSDYIDAEIDLFNENPNAVTTLSYGNMSRVFYLLMQARDKQITESEAMAEIDALRQIDGMKQIEDYFFRKTVVQQHNLGIAGGTEEYNYNIAVNYQGSRENVIESNSKRLIFDLKNEWRPFKFLTAGASANMTVDNRSSSLGTNYSGLTAYTSGSLLRPYTNLWDESGNPADLWGISLYKVNGYQNMPGMKPWNYSSIRDVDETSYDSKDFTSRITGFLRAQIIKGLTAEVGGNWVRGNTFSKSIQGADSYALRIAYNDNTSRSNPANHYIPDGAAINEGRGVNQSWTLRSQLNYAKDFKENKYRLNVLLGNEIRKFTFDNNTLATRLGYNPTAGSYIPVNIKDYSAGIYRADMLFPILFSGVTDGGFRYGDNRFVSWYANAAFEYDDRFIVSGSTRLDLTNFFGTDEKYRYKPMWSLGGTYKMSNDGFWNGDIVNKLHLRASYGINGNISLNNGPFLILSVIDYTPTTGGVSYGISSPPNNQLRWEKTKIANFGVDFGLFGSRLEGSWIIIEKIARIYWQTMRSIRLWDLELL